MVKGSQNFKYAGRWWQNPNIDMVEIDGAVYALNGWNGEQYTDCWKCSGAGNREASDERYIITPIYEEIDKNDIKIVGYEIQKK